MSSVAEKLRQLRREAGILPSRRTEEDESQERLGPLTVIPAKAGIHLDFEQKKLDPGLTTRSAVEDRRDDEPMQHRCKPDDAPPRRLPLRDIHGSNVPSGLLKSRSDPRGNEQPLQDNTPPLTVIPAKAGIQLPSHGIKKEDNLPSRLDILRRQIRAREKQSPISQSRRILSAPAGEEIAPGLHYVEAKLPYRAGVTLDVPAIDEAPIDRRRLLCFDTETTGLAGGVGTRAFMIGVAAWEADVLTARQLYLTAIAGERAMLETFAGWLRPETILVSYNGKSYDAPLLKGRFRLNRVGHRLAELPHIDWLHPTRRVYKGHLPNCKLATIEREVLRIVREDDLPGSEAPAAWLAYLRGQSSTNLARVLDHNRQDVITLMRLGDHLTSQ